jgi:branched-chain amino acid transport system substrate-binding protein
MYKRGTAIYVVVASMFLLMMLAACGAGTTTGKTATSPAQGTITIKIGSDFPTTVKDASAGKPAENGVAYAVNEANSTNFLPGYKFELDAKDDVGVSGSHDQTVGKQNVTALIGDAQVAGIVGPLNSSIAQAEMPTANQAPIAMISPSTTNDCLTQNTPDYECGGTNSLVSELRPTGKVTYFRIATLDQYQGAALADYAYKTSGYHKAYVIDDTETYGVGLAKTFVTEWKKLGGTELGSQSIASTDSYESLLTTIADTHPDCIFFGGNDSTGAITIRQQMRQVAGLEHVGFVIGDGAKTSNFAKNIASLGGGPVIASVPGLDATQVPVAKDFIENFTRQYGLRGAYSAGSYDAARIILQAIKTAIQQKHVVVPGNQNDTATARTFRQAVIDAIQSIQYDGVTGHHSFDQNGDTTNKAISIYTLADDATVGDGWKYLTTVTPHP